MPSRSPSRHHPWSMHLVTVAGIPVRVHFTFWLLILWIAMGQWRATGGFGAHVGFVLALFGCVVLHELGHALVARAFGIRTRDITLYPIGGVASLESMGSPRQELFISLAGPLVNFLIAIALAFYLAGTGQTFAATAAGGEVDLRQLGFVERLLLVNVSLALFNLLPAFPMDGGRVLRAALALKMGRERATRVAATVGQGMAVLMGLAGLLTGNFLLVFVALFVFLGAGAEAAMTQRMATTAGYRVRDAMVTKFETLRHGETLETAVRHLLSSHQQDFPVVHGDMVLGVLTRQHLLETLAADGQGALVSAATQREVPRVGPDMDLAVAFELLKRSNGTPLLVFEDDRLLGMITFENLVEFISVARAGGAPDPAEPSAPGRSNLAPEQRRQP